jgi:amino acid adenylation domain-containing protein
VQYADYAVWQREQLEGEVLERQLAYWRERLAGAPELLELPTDRPRPPVQTYRGRVGSGGAPRELLERLQALGRSEGATLYMVLLAAFQVLLAKYAGARTWWWAARSPGRTRGEVEGLIGFFVNTLVLRTDLSGDPSFREVLRRVREVDAGRVRAPGGALRALVAELQPERSLSHSPLFQVMFQPPARLAQLLAAARSRVALTSTETGSRLREAAGRLPESARPRLLDIDESAGGSGGPPVAARPTAGRQLAYVLFTSGSTGVPKGPMIDHQGLANHLWTLVRQLGLGPGDRVAQNASQCFDVSVWQLLGVLLVGGRVVVLPDAVAHDPARLLDAIEREEITVLEIVPSLLRDLLDEVAARPRPPRLPRLRWVIPTGEELPPSLARRWLTLFPDVPLLNAYGPAECSDDVSWSRLDRLPPDGSPPPVTLGRSLPNLSLYVVDARLELLPAGGVGELCVGGVAVGRGYLGDPRRTAASFVPDRFGAEQGGRLYRTGDLARLLPSGELEFRGRLDHQVKIRGQRVEPGEVEAVLASHPAVAEGAVVVRDLPDGAPCLVAYAVSAATALAKPAELRTFLAGRLPAYMVPQHFVVLPALPRNANGKLDRAALPTPELPSAAGGGAGGAFRTPIEEVTAGIWGEVLQIGEVGRDDDFFTLGGHSLLATRVLSRLRQALDVELPVRALFEAPRLAALARRVEAARQDRDGHRRPALGPAGREAPLPLSYAQERLWYEQRLDPESATYNMPVGYRFAGSLSAVALEEALAELGRRHEVLRTVYAEVDGRPVQVPQPALLERRPVVDLSGLASEARSRLAGRLLREAAARPFDLERGPVLRGHLLRLGAEDHHVSLTVHHIACDGWSLDVLAREVAALYAAFAAGRPSPLAEAEVQYADFAVWQRGWLAGEILDEHVAYWRQCLAGAPAVVDLPLDRELTRAPSSRGAVWTFRLPAEPASELRRLGREEQTTLFVVLFAAFVAALSRWSGQEDLVVGTDLAGRDRLETEELIGFFVSNLPLRANLSGNPPFREIVRRVGRTALEAWSHQDLPFHLLVERLRLPRVPGRNPVFQVTHVHQNVPAGALELPQVAARPVEPEHATAPFDLTLSTQESPDGTLSAVLRYRVDLWEEETVARWAADLEGLLVDVAADPEVRLASLDLGRRGRRRGRGPASRRPSLRRSPPPRVAPPAGGGAS